MKSAPRTHLASPRPITVSGPEEIRVGPLRTIPAVLGELGVDPRRAFEQAGVDLGVLNNPDNRIRIQDLGRLIDACVALTRCRHFGLLVGERFDLRTLGALGELLRNSATVGDAINNLLRHLHVVDRGATPVLCRSRAGWVALGYSIYRQRVPARAALYDAAIAVGYRLVAQLCGPAWQARHVQLSHARPAGVAVYHRVFGPRVRFDAELSAIVFAASWLDKPIDGAVPARCLQLARSICAAEAGDPVSVAERVRGALPQRVLNGTASAAAVASALGIHERTLRRRLEAEGTSLRQLVNLERFELAQQLLRDTALSVTRIAAALHYDDPNTFTRAFRNWAKLSPTQWRELQ